MPYIKPEERRKFEYAAAVLAQQIETPGQLNFVITTILVHYWNRVGIAYDKLNEVIGVLECAKMEAYRRLIGPYEDKKIDENGDVY